MRSFIDTYKPEKGYMINFDLDNEIKIGDCIIRFVSARRFAEGIDAIL